jgi:glutathionylspermidine synthase
MKKCYTNPRSNWKENIEQQGLIYHTHDEGQTYWNESSYYQFSLDEINNIEEITNSLYQMMLETVEYIVDKDLLEELKIPPKFHQYIKNSWIRKDPSLYGRMDFAYDGTNPPKLLEFNADTPTTLLESAVCQWLWMEDLKNNGSLDTNVDQFNSVHDKLIERFKEIKEKMRPQSTMFFSSLPTPEDTMNTEYIRDVASQAGIDTAYIQIDHISLKNNHRFCTPDGQEIDYIFKLYPWEWMFSEQYGEVILRDETGWIEPAWKAILSNKSILKFLWKLFPNHENLLECSDKIINEPYVKKPIYGREGANISIIGTNNDEITTGTYGSEGFIYQKYSPLYKQDGQYAMLGSWIVGDESCGMTIRENSSPVINNRSKFLPHIIV